MTRNSKSPRSPAFCQSDAAIASDEACDPDPALIIGICLAFWRKGGIPAVPPLLMKMLADLAQSDAASAATFSMMTGRKCCVGEQLELDLGLGIQPLPMPASAMLGHVGNSAHCKVQQIGQMTAPGFRGSGP